MSITNLWLRWIYNRKLKRIITNFSKDTLLNIEEIFYTCPYADQVIEAYDEIDYVSDLIFSLEFLPYFTNHIESIRESNDIKLTTVTLLLLKRKGE